MKHVIVGNGPAGVFAAETLRRLQPAADIVLIGDEPEPPYSRMAIPYFLHGNITEQGTYLRKDADHYARLNIRLVQGRVARVAPLAKQVEFADGQRQGYDKLLIATGSRPIRPSVPGMDLPNVHTCWTLADARAIAEKAKPGSRVLQLGAGFIGCIIMEALAARGVKLAVVEMGDRMVPRMMTETAGGMIRCWVEAKGIAVHVNAAITAIERQGDALAVKVSGGGTPMMADLVICAAGVRPNIEFLAGSGIEMGRGIRVDGGMRTSVADIFAAGDVTEATGFHSGQPELNAIQPNAADQARIAAHNMADDASASQGSLAINVLDTLGLISTSFGQWQGVGDGVELVDAENFRYLSLQFKDDVLIGATSIGCTDHVGALRGLIQTRARLGAWKDRLLADPTSFMAAYLATAQKAA
ncbi:MAG: NAD(P)/FAD-dependent oxidoreductase [Rhodocyclaceae bacterium]|jgi:NAD(P)H-nitrite reductase large subunit|nr:NAD(P)/FAD-dependent oxidoreductase [Rhodocyclaceae bacterium]MBK6552608.1 NAD(P)/FAD-dependent oxidoreductase [Rhodocyclaceae bacterium]MBK9312147.1 NAD(P)/FAD-dependent oxidoreductase [Rhodocyclaceae bacterium]MBK9956192.1 NAD(P)/FAD-dependent oxidoreductase [Rhodocyclaceae bacterium]